MTRFLSEALQATEPYFRQGLAKLEAANGHPAGDIRLSTTVMNQTRTKLRQLGLDPSDTTAQELYHVLQSRVKDDDERLVHRLRLKAADKVSMEARVADGIIAVLKEAAGNSTCFAVKNSALKTIIKRLPPKKTLKSLGYRSLDSLIKHETTVSIMAAAWLLEGERWQEHLLESYKKLKPGDFESRSLNVVLLDSGRWQGLVNELVEQYHHNLISFKEMGSLVVLPFAATMPAGSATITLALALHELNEIRAASTFLKLSQVRSNFGQQIQAVVSDEPRLAAEMLDKQMPWQLVQRYYSNQSQSLGSVFEPHVQAEDLSWQAVEEVLSELEPSFDFWHHSAHLGLLHDHQPVSLNLLDAAINHCNSLPFEKRLLHYFQKSLWQELFMTYLQPETIERAISQQLQPQLAAEAATV